MTRPHISAAELVRRVVRMERGQRLAVIGLDWDRLGEMLTLERDQPRNVLLVATKGLFSTAAILDGLLDDLAGLALACWPNWYGHEMRPGAPGEVMGSNDPVVSVPWLQAATGRAEAGRPPRFRHAARETELGQLLHAIDPAGVVLIAEIDPASEARAAPVIAVLESCAAHGACVIAALSVAPPETSPYDRILYGACDLLQSEASVAERFIAPRSLAHHASVIERRVEQALQRDAELGDLFSCNAPVSLGALGERARVDLLCRDHGIVVELDGPEHRTRAMFGNDRHRDYALLVAGYLVLRITNEQVEADLQQAVEKIRAVVRLRRRPRTMETG